MSKKIKSDIMLLITALIWGSAFVAQKAGTVLEPFTYNGIRMFIGGLVLIPIIFIFKKINEKKGAVVELPDSEKALGKKALLIGGLSCGVVLCIASTLQQFGMCLGTDAGKAGFITSLYIVIVPILGLLLKKRVRPLVWFCIAFGAAGFYMLTMVGKGAGLTLSKGDLLVLFSAVMFSCYILLVDHFSSKCDGIKLSCIQFLVTGVIGLIGMALFEDPDLSKIISCWGPILYCGVMSSGVGYTLQVVAQKDAEPTTATLIMSLEAVFSVLFGALLLHESMTFVEGLGCVVIFIAVVIPQLPTQEERLKARNEQ